MKIIRVFCLWMLALMLCALCLCTPRAEASSLAANFAATVDSVPYDTLQEAVDNAGDKVVTVHKDGSANLKANLKIDLNGCNVTLEGKYTVYAMDSATDSYDGTKAGTLSASKVEAIDRNTVDMKCYLPIETEEGVYELHRFYMAEYQKFLNPNLDGMGVSINFCGSTAVKNALSAYGVQLCLDEGFDSKVITAPISSAYPVGDDAGNKRIVLTNAMDLAEQDIYVRAYVTTKDGATIASSVWSINMQDLVESADTAYSGYTYEQKLALQKFSIKNTAKVGSWQLSALKPVAAYDYSLGEGTIDFSQFGKDPAGVEIFHADGTTAITSAVSGNVVTLSGDAVMNADPATATGASNILLVKSGDDLYQLKTNLYTLAIRTPEEFLTLPNYYDPDTKTQKGCYVLCNDLDFSGKDSYFNNDYHDGRNYDKGFLGTFDGRNHIVKNLSIRQGSAYGLFGTLSGYGVIKNVAFVDVTHAGGEGFLCSWLLGKIENVLVTGKLADTDFIGRTLLIGESHSANYCTVRNTTVVETVIPTFDRLENSRLLSLGTQTVFAKSSVVAIAAGTSDRFVADLSTDDITSANANFMLYDFAFDAADDSTLTANGSANFATADGTYTIKWNGTTVYTTTVG